MELLQTELLRNGGSIVEVVAPNQALLFSLAKNGTMMLNSAPVPGAYEIGERQALDDVDPIRPRVVCSPVEATLDFRSGDDSSPEPYSLRPCACLCNSTQIPIRG